jgi:hypothetical protein
MDTSNPADRASALEAYIECALWAGLDWDNMIGDNPEPLDKVYTASDLAPETREQLRAELDDFAEANARDLAEIEPAQVGHDFHLTRNRHGAGFWDRGLGAVGERLTTAAHVYGTCDLYAGDDGRLYAHG